MTSAEHINPGSAVVTAEPPMAETPTSNPTVAGLDAALDATASVVKTPRKRSSGGGRGKRNIPPSSAEIPAGITQQTPAATADPDLEAVLNSFDPSEPADTNPQPQADAAKQPDAAAPAGGDDAELQAVLDSFATLTADPVAVDASAQPQADAAKQPEPAAAPETSRVRENWGLGLVKGIGARFKHSNPPSSSTPAVTAEPADTNPQPQADAVAEGPTTPVVTGGLLDFARGLVNRRRPAPVAITNPAGQPTPAGETSKEPGTAEPTAVDVTVPPPSSAEPAVSGTATEHPAVVPDTATDPAESIRQETVIDRIASSLENTRVFGKPLPELAFRNLGLGGVRWGAKELAKGIVSWSGAAGAIGGGIAGTAVTGAFVGAAAGAAVEYVRQVNTNLNQRIEANPNPNLTSRKAAFLRKFGGTRHGEVYTNINKGKLAKAAIFGAITGAGAGAIADIPVVREFLDEQISRFMPGLNTAQQAISTAAGGAKDAAGNFMGGVGGAVGDAGGTVGRTVGDLGGNVGQAVGDKMGELGGAIYETRSDIGEWANIGGAGDAAKEAIRQADETARQTAEAAKEAARQADFDQLRSQFSNQKAIIDNLSNQVTDLQTQVAAAQKAASEAQSALRASGITDGLVPKADLDAANARIDDLQKQFAAIKQAGASAAPSADQAAAHAAEAAQTQVQKASANFGDSYVLHPGDSVAGIAETDALQKLAAIDQAAAHAAEAAQTQLHGAFAALNLGDNYSLHGGDSVAGIAEKLGRSLGLTNTQVWELGQKMAQENGVTSQYYGTVGNVLDKNLPIGKVMNMQGVKGLALQMLKDKTKQ